MPMRVFVRRPVPRRIVAGALGLLTACYSFQPLDTTPPAGTNVSAVLTDAGSLALGPLIGARTARVDGRLLRFDDSTLVLAVTEVQDRRSEATDWKGEVVTLPRSDIASIQHRKLSAAKTMGALGLAIGIAALATTISLAAGGTGGSGGAGSTGSSH
jgi:hypothetical protein